MSHEKMIVSIQEKRNRVSTDFITQDQSGTFNSKNNWTFDILTTQLFKAIFSQIITNSTSVKTCYLLWPKHDSFSENDIFQVSEDILSDLENEFNICIHIFRNKDCFVQAP